ncbi:MAG: hypothetical protein ACK4ND_10610 [Cytophagaceae bacterium]
MRSYFLTFKPLLIFFICLAFSASGQDEDYEDIYFEERDEYLDYLLGPKQLSPEEFNALPNNKIYRELRAKLPKEKIKAYQPKDNVYLELLDALERQIKIEGLGEIDQRLSLNMPLRKSTIPGLTLTGILQNGVYIILQLVNEKSFDYMPEVLEAGGMFHLESFNDWKSNELSIEKGTLFSAQVSKYDREEGAVVQVRLSDYMMLTFLDPSGGNKLDKLKKFATNIDYSELKSFAEYLKNYNPEQQKFLTLIKKDWPVSIPAKGNNYRIQHMNFGHSDWVDDKEYILGYNCKADGSPLEESSYFPDEIAYGENTAVRKIELDGYPYYFYTAYSGQEQMFVSDGKSFVDIPSDGTAKPGKKTRARVNNFFSLPLDCKSFTKQQDDLNKLIKKVADDELRTKELDEAQRIDLHIEKLKSTQSYQELAEMLSKNIKTPAKKLFPAETSILEDFKDVLKDLKSDLIVDVMSIKGISMGNMILNGQSQIPGKTVIAEGKAEGKKSNFSISLRITNKNFPGYFTYPLYEMAPLFLSQDGYLIKPLIDGNLSSKMLGNLPSSYTEIKMLGKLSALAVYLSDHAVLFLTGFQAHYSKSELEAIVAQLDAEKLLALAEKHQDIDKNYWDMLEIFPKEVLNEGLTVLSTDQKNIKRELPQMSGDFYSLFISYGHPIISFKGGSFYFNIKCQDGEEEFLAEDLIEKMKTESYKGESIGKYTVFRFQDQKQKEWQTIVHKDVPGKQVTQTFNRQWNLQELDEYFKDFFTLPCKCDSFRAE